MDIASHGSEYIEDSLVRDSETSRGTPVCNLEEVLLACGLPLAPHSLPCFEESDHQLGFLICQSLQWQNNAPARSRITLFCFRCYLHGQSLTNLSGFVLCNMLKTSSLTHHFSLKGAGLTSSSRLQIEVVSISWIFTRLVGWLSYLVLGCFAMLAERYKEGWCPPYDGCRRGEMWRWWCLRQFEGMGREYLVLI